MKWIFIIGSAGAFILADSLSANWGKTGNLFSLLLSFLVAPCGYFIFALLNQNTTLSASSVLVNMFLLLGTVGVGVFFFGDSMSQKQLLGLVFAIIAVILVY